MNQGEEPNYLRVSGTPYQAGLAHGRAKRQIILDTWREHCEPLSAKWDQAALAGRMEFLSAETRQRFPEEIEEVRGIADGAEVEFNRVFTIYRHLGRALLCSAAAVTHSDHGPVAGGNLDDPCVYFLLDRSIPGEYRHIVTAWPGTLGGGNGMNEHGLVLVGSSAQPRYTPFAPEPAYRTDDFGIVARVLRRCRTVDEAVRFISRADIGALGNHVLLDAAGNAACVEKRGVTLLAVRKPDAAGFIFSLNYFASEYHSPERMAELPPKNLDRLDAMQRHRARLNEHNGLEVVTGIMHDTVAGPRSENWSVSSPKTALGMLCFPRERKMLATFGPPHLCRQHTYTLA